MRSSKISKRYAKGLLLFAQETDVVENVFLEMKDVIKVMNASQELKIFLSSPFIHAKIKISAVEKIFEKFSKTVRNMIVLAIKRNREVYLEDIAHQYINFVEELKGVQKVSLITASKLSEQNVKNILLKSNLVDTHKPFDLKVTVNSDIIGGYIIKVGDKQIDASVKANLINLRKEFQLN